VISNLKTRLQELQKAQSPCAPAPAHHVEHGDPREWADQIRRLYAEGDEIQAEAIELVAHDQAEEIEAKYGADKAERWYRTATTINKTLDDWLDQWLTSVNLKEQTKANYRRAYGDLRTMLKQDVLVLDDITDEVAVRYVMDYLPAQRYSAKSIANRISALSSFWSYLQQRLVVPRGRHNPWQGHRPSQLSRGAVSSKRQSPQDERPFTDAELVALLHGTERCRGWEVYTSVRDLLLLGL